jgi:pimeloyl-ACP methyl ester carboxylesterase
MRRCVALLIAALALVGCGGASRPKAVKAEALPGYVVETDGHKVYFDCEGTGSPTVVFLSGWGEDSSSWGSVFDGSSHMTRSCEYDRYGLGLTSVYSALPRKARDAHDQVREFEQLLRNAAIAKPYVLVGHSWGGALARLYAGTHDDVKAVVFVDSSSPGQDTALAAAVPPKRADEPELFTELRNAHASDPLHNPENLDWAKSLAEVGEVTSLGNRPEIVITAGNTFAGIADVLFPVWSRLQNKLAGLSSRSVHVLAPTSTHFVQTDAPEVVLASVRAAVNAVRDDGHLASCAAIFRHVADGKCLQ